LLYGYYFPVSFNKILGLDLSLTSTGYCHNGESDVIRVKTKGDERLRDISCALQEIRKKLDIDLVIIEGYSFASMFSRAHAIGELGGVVRLDLFNEKVPYIVIPPTCRAKFATGKGNSKKADVMHAISEMTGINWDGAGGDDRCDAWILEEMALTKLGRSNYTWGKENLDALKKVDWSVLEGLND
jgi:Holliday junction resolvasome RuvABC endonuclease subunit